MLSSSYYAKNYANIVNTGLWWNLIRLCSSNAAHVHTVATAVQNFKILHKIATLYLYGIFQYATAVSGCVAKIL